MLLAGIIGTAMWFASTPFLDGARIAGRFRPRLKSDLRRREVGRSPATLLVPYDIPNQIQSSCLAYLYCCMPLTAATCSAGSLVPVELRCEYLVNPRGIDETEPRLSWKVESDRRGQMQSAYQIHVASSLEKLAAGNADLWNSGKVQSRETLHIAYAGQTLKSRKQCYWKNQVMGYRRQCVAVE